VCYLPRVIESVVPCLVAVHILNKCLFRNLEKGYSTSPSCHPSRQQMRSSATCAGQTHLPRGCTRGVEGKSGTVGGRSPGATFGFYLEEAFQSLTNAKYIIQQESLGTDMLKERKLHKI